MNAQCPFLFPESVKVIDRLAGSKTVSVREAAEHAIETCACRQIACAWFIEERGICAIKAIGLGVEK